MVATLVLYLSARYLTILLPLSLPLGYTLTHQSWCLVWVMRWVVSSRPFALGRPCRLLGLVYPLLLFPCEKTRFPSPSVSSNSFVDSVMTSE